MLIYYFELKKAAFWFNDFQQPSLGDIQMPLGLCDLPSRGLAALRDLFISRKGAEKQRNCLPLPSAAVDYYFSQRRKGELKLKLEVFLYFSRPRLLISFRQALSQRFAASRAFFS